MGQAPRPRQQDQAATARQARLVALVIAGTMILWLGAQWLGGALDWPARYAFLFDFAALAALFWSLVATYRIRRKTRDPGGSGTI